MNPKVLATQLDGYISAVSPAWANARANRRAAAAQARYIEAGYDAAANRTQRSAGRGNNITSEYGAMTDSDLSTIIEWSSDTWRNNSIMSGLGRRAADNIIGSGLLVRPMTDGGAELNDELGRAFQEYTARGGGWEVTGQFSFGQAQRMTFFTVVRAADLVMYRSDDGWQFFEGGQIGTPLGYDREKTKIIQGVQIDQRGAPDYYWVANYSKYGYLDAKTAKGLRADLCQHIVNREFFSGYRGVPIWGNALGRFEDLDRYLEAELLGAMAGTCIVGEINSNAKNAHDILNTDKGKTDGGKSDEKHNRHQMAPGMIIRTYLGEKFNLHSPNRPGSSVPEFVRLNLRFVGFPVGMPLELGLMDFTQTNYAAAKMAVNQAALTQHFWRDEIVTDGMIGPVYRDWLTFQKAVKVPASVKRVTHFEVIPPKSAWLDEYKQSLALNEGLDGGWDTVTRIAKEEMNRTVRDIYLENADEILLAKKVCEEKGLPEGDWEKVRAGMRRDKADKVASGKTEAAA